jgi:citrate lyase subunit beta/citryl-CoA lyase
MGHQKEASMDIQRSLMFVPGSSEKMLTKALGLHELDLAMFDLEDGVTPPNKAAARDLVAAMLQQPAGGPHRFVRINAVGSEWIEADLQTIVVPGLEGLVLPKVEHTDQIAVVESLVSQQERQGGVQVGAIQFIVAIESALGLLNAPSIAASNPRILGLMFGAEDYSLDLGLPTQREGEARELIYARSAIVVAAASAHVQAMDGVWPDYRDPDGLRTDAIQARRLGFSGKSTFHPGQIALINEIFSPSEQDVEHARRVVAAFDEAQEQGQASTALGGQLIDLPIVERARRVIDLYEGRRSSASA